MRLIQNLLFALAVACAATTAAASPEAPANGREYHVLPQAQPTNAGSKVEVTEFFAYSCPHCHVFDPVLAEWVRKNQDKVLFKRVHVALNRADIPLQRLYVTLEAMGLTEQYHSKIFKALHVDNARLNSDEALFDWAQKAGIDREKFIGTYRSFGMQSRVNRAESMTRDYMINSWPTLSVDGRFITSPYQASSTTRPAPDESAQQAAALKVVDFLVAKSAADRKKK